MECSGQCCGWAVEMRFDGRFDGGHGSVVGANLRYRKRWGLTC